MRNQTAENEAALTRLNLMLDQLLGPQGCPWDRRQSMESLCAYALEEMYELIDAVRNKGAADQREELGDVLFILLFMAWLGNRDGLFTLAEALEESRLKMIGRHPHVFGERRDVGQDELLRAWEAIKREEKARKAAGRPAGAFASLPVDLPALLKAYRIHSKSASNCFTWDTDEDAEMQVEAEWLEFLDACREREPGGHGA